MRIKRELKLFGFITGCLLVGILVFSCTKQGKNSDTGENSDSQGGTGCVIKEEEFEKAPIFTPLSDELAKNGIPAKVSLLKYAPKRKNQGNQSSCVAWSSCYAARTILEAQSKGVDPNDAPFSPAYIYNQIKQGDCMAGSLLNDALSKLRSEGVLPLKDYPYSERDCNKIPGSIEKQQASTFKIEGYTRLTKSQGFEIDLKALKQNLAKGGPILLGMPVGGSFEMLRYPQKLWKPTEKDKQRLQMFKSGQYQQSGLGGHAMCAIGYDDTKGTVEIMNSWGENWGDKGIFEIGYADFRDWCMEAYGIYPLRSVLMSKEKADFKASVGLFQTTTKKYIPLKSETGYNLNAQAKKGTRFKLEVGTSTPAYLYIIAQELDGTSNLLFPYTPKHSAYTGIPGARLFPADHTLYLDAKGKEDVFAVLLSKKELDINALNTKISQSKAGTYEQKIQEVLKNDLIPSNKLKFDAGETVDIEAQKSDQSVVPMIIKIQK